MVDYLKTILPRIQQYSKQLNDEANFVDVPWGFLDEDGQKVTYIFRRSGELLVSKKGDVVTGHWEYLPMVQSMLIEHEGQKRMYNKGFLDKAVMLLRKDGTDALFAMANMNILKNMDIEGYLNSNIRLLEGGKKPFHNPKRPVLPGKLKDGTSIYLLGRPGYQKVGLGQRPEVFFTETDLPVPNGKYTVKGGNKIVIEEGKLIKYYGPLDHIIYIIGLILLIVLVLTMLSVFISGS